MSVKEKKKMLHRWLLVVFVWASLVSSQPTTPVPDTVAPTTPAPGTHVRSHFRARWSGTVIADNHWTQAHCVRVNVTHDRRGRPLRKPLTKTLDATWLVVIPELPRWPWQP